MINWLKKNYKFAMLFIALVTAVSPFVLSSDGAEQVQVNEFSNSSNISQNNIIGNNNDVKINSGSNVPIKLGIEYSQLKIQTRIEDYFFPFLSNAIKDEYRNSKKLNELRSLLNSKSLFSITLKNESSRVVKNLLFKNLNSDDLVFISNKNFEFDNLNNGQEFIEMPYIAPNDSLIIYIFSKFYLTYIDDIRIFSEESDIIWN